MRRRLGAHPAAAERLVTGGYGAEQGLEYKTHGDQVTVERRPAKHVDREYDGLGGVHRRPDKRPVVVIGRHKPRHEQPHDQRAEAEPDERAEYRGQPGPAQAQLGRVAATALGERVAGRAQCGPHLVRVGGHHVALEQAH